MSRMPGLRAVLLQIVGVPAWLVVVSAVVLSSLLVATALLTVGYSVVRRRQRTRREATREDLQGELFDRLYRPERPDWRDWVGRLSGHERTVLESLLDEYLRELHGSDAEALREVGHALGIPERSRRRLETGSHYERLHALTWLALLEDPPSEETIAKHCTHTSRERAAAVRTLYETGHPNLSSVGVDLLVCDAGEGLSVFGIDTLYRVAEVDPDPLFERAGADADSWHPAVLQQVLLVSRHVPTVAGSADLSWIVRALSDSEERTRIEAARALGGYGWRRSIRDDLDIESLCTDPSPRVRASVYRMLGEWGDEDAIGTLLSVAPDDPDERARVAAAEALVSHREYHSFGVPETLAAEWSWAREHESFERTAADVSPQGERGQ